MRVTWVNPSFGQYRVSVYAELARRLDGGFRVIYSPVRLNEETRALVDTELRFCAVGLDGEWRVRVPLSRRVAEDYANTSLQIPYQPGLLTALARQRPDVVIGEGFFQWTPAAAYWRERSNAALVVAYERTAHTERHAGWLRKLYRRVVARRVDAVCCNGQLSREYCCDELGIPSSKVVVGAMAADSLYLRRNMHEAGSGADVVARAPRPCFMYVGRLVGSKGVDTLLAAWCAHEKATHASGRGSLHIVGSGPARERLAKYVVDNGLKAVNFVGSVPHRVMGAFYSEADVFVLPTREDNWSLVVPEAMAFGNPVITTTGNGCWPELVRPDETGWLIKPDDVEGLTRLLNRCSANPEALARMGASGSELVGRYTPESVADAFLTAIDIARQNRHAGSR